MVLPSPFERLLQEVVEVANRDPAAAFARLDELYGKSLTEQDVLQLSAFAGHLGATGLGRWDETTTFLRRLLQHPTLQVTGAVARSLWRGLAVVLICAGRKDEASEAIAKGVITSADACRLAVMLAQTLAMRGRSAEAVPQLQRAAMLCRELKPDDEVVGQVAMVADNLQRLVEPQVRLAQDLLLAASEVGKAAWLLHPDWRARHRAWFQYGQACLLAARPTHTLAAVKEMMELEDGNDGGPMERFHTANLACRAQAVRGQFKVAAGALEACQDFAKRIDDLAAVEAVRTALAELEKFVAELRKD
jgi:hypothetical protein